MDENDAFRTGCRIAGILRKISNKLYTQTWVDETAIVHIYSKLDRTTMELPPIVKFRGPYKFRDLEHYLKSEANRRGLAEIDGKLKSPSPDVNILEESEDDLSSWRQLGAF